MAKKNIKKGCLTCRHSSFERTDAGSIVEKVPGRCNYKLIPPEVPCFLEKSVNQACSSSNHGIWPKDGKECKCWHPSDSAIISNQGFPRYIKLSCAPEHLCAVAHVGNGLYWRDAGHWNIQIENRDGKLIAVDGKQHNMSHMDGKEVYPCTQKEWIENNGDYIGGSYLFREINSWKEDKNGKPEIPY